MSDGDLRRLPSDEPADSPSMPATSSRHQQLKTLAVTIGVAFTVVIILISRFQPLTLQARTSGWQVASDTSPNVSVTLDNTVTDNSIFHVAVTALRTRVEGPVPVLTQGVTLCRHFDPVQQQCISGGGASLVKPFRPFALSPRAIINSRGSKRPSRCAEIHQDASRISRQPSVST
jgi:hypothetical protein